MFKFRSVPVFYYKHSQIAKITTLNKVLLRNCRSEAKKSIVSRGVSSFMKFTLALSGTAIAGTYVLRHFLHGDHKAVDDKITDAVPELKPTVNFVRDKVQKVRRLFILPSKSDEQKTEGNAQNTGTPNTRPNKQLPPSIPQSDEQKLYGQSSAENPQTAKTPEQNQQAHADVPKDNTKWQKIYEKEYQTSQKGEIPKEQAQPDNKLNKEPEITPQDIHPNSNSEIKHEPSKPTSKDLTNNVKPSNTPMSENDERLARGQKPMEHYDKRDNKKTGDKQTEPEPEQRDKQDNKKTDNKQTESEKRDKQDNKKTDNKQTESEQRDKQANKKTDDKQTGSEQRDKQAKKNDQKQTEPAQKDKQKSHSEENPKTKEASQVLEPTPLSKKSPEETLPPNQHQSKAAHDKQIEQQQRPKETPKNPQVLAGTSRGD